jgi:hypothetical protein
MLVTHSDRSRANCRVVKSFDWATMERLHAKGYISNPISCVRWVRHRARHCCGDGQWARLSVLYFGGAVRCDSDAFAAVKPVTRDTA